MLAGRVSHAYSLLRSDHTHLPTFRIDRNALDNHVPI